MSFSIAVNVEGGVATIASQTSDTAAPPDGMYHIGGHVGTDWSSVSIACAVGTASATIYTPPPVATQESQ